MSSLLYFLIEEKFISLQNWVWKAYYQFYKQEKAVLK